MWDLIRLFFSSVASSLPSGSLRAAFAGRMRARIRCANRRPMESVLGVARERTVERYAVVPPRAVVKLRRRVKTDSCNT